MLWTTRYIDAAVAQFQAEGHEFREEDMPGSPAQASEPEPARPLQLHRLDAGALRPLRDADAQEPDDDGRED